MNRSKSNDWHAGEATTPDIFARLVQLSVGWWVTLGRPRAQVSVASTL